MTPALTSLPKASPIGVPHGVQTPELLSGSGDPDAKAELVRAPLQRPTISHSKHPTDGGPLAAAVGPLARPQIQGTTIAAGQPGLDTSWEGLSLFDQRYADNGNQFTVTPPDQGLCVGNGYVVEVVNTVLRIYRTSGKPATGVIALNEFYGYAPQINRKTLIYGPDLTDPSCLYDGGSKRFFSVILTLEQNSKTGEATGANHLDLAVSRTSSPLGAWDIYRLPVQDDGTQGTPKHKGCPCIGDYPHIAADAHGIYLTTNEYPFGDSPGVFGNYFNGAQIYAIDKDALVHRAARVHVVQYESLFVAAGGQKLPGFTVWPAQVPDSGYDLAGNGTEHFLSSTATGETQPKQPTGLANRLVVWRLTGTASLQAGGQPTLTRSLLGSETYGVPPFAQQKTGGIPLAECIETACADLGVPQGREDEGPIDPLDSRMQQVWLADGRLMGALDTIAIVNGNLQTAVAWFSIIPGATTASAAMARDGYLAIAGQNVTFPAIATLASGTGVMGLTVVGKGFFPTAAYAPFDASTGPGAVSIARLGQAPLDDFGEYQAFGYDPRYGDYAAAAVSNGSLWFANEYVESSCTFAQYVASGLTCGNTRVAFGNWSTRISRYTP